MTRANTPESFFFLENQKQKEIGVPWMLETEVSSCLVKKDQLIAGRTPRLSTDVRKKRPRADMGLWGRRCLMAFLVLTCILIPEDDGFLWPQIFIRLEWVPKNLQRTLKTSIFWVKSPNSNQQKVSKSTRLDPVFLKKASWLVPRSFFHLLEGLESCQKHQGMWWGHLPGGHCVFSGGRFFLESLFENFSVEFFVGTWDVCLIFQLGAYPQGPVGHPSSGPPRRFDTVSMKTRTYSEKVLLSYYSTSKNMVYTTNSVFPKFSSKKFSKNSSSRRWKPYKWPWANTFRWQAPSNLGRLFTTGVILFFQRWTKMVNMFFKSLKLSWWKFGSTLVFWCLKYVLP